MEEEVAELLLQEEAQKEVGVRELLGVEVAEKEEVATVWEGEAQEEAAAELLLVAVVLLTEEEEEVRPTAAVATETRAHPPPPSGSQHPSRPVSPPVDPFL